MSDCVHPVRFLVGPASSELGEYDILDLVADVEIFRTSDSVFVDRLDHSFSDNFQFPFLEHVFHPALVPVCVFKNAIEVAPSHIVIIVEDEEIDQ